MKKPSNKAISIFILWELLHAALWAMASNSGGNKSRFFPLAHEEWIEPLNKFPWFRTYFATEYFQVDQVYDSTEFLFYTIAPIMIYYAILLWNNPTKEQL